MKNTKNIKLIVASSLISTPAMAIEKGDILLDVRLLSLSPDAGSNQIMAGGVPLAPPAGIDMDWIPRLRLKLMA